MVGLSDEKVIHMHGCFAHGIRAFAHMGRLCSLLFSGHGLAKWHLGLGLGILVIPFFSLLLCVI